MSEPKLFYSPTSLGSKAALLCLAEKGAAAISQPIDLGKLEHLDPNLVRRLGTCQGPVLLHDGKTVLGGVAIARHVDEAFSGESLAGDDAESEEVEHWMARVAEVRIDELALATPPYPLPFARLFSRHRLKGEIQQVQRLAQEFPDLAEAYRGEGRRLRHCYRALGDLWRINDIYRGLNVLLETLDGALEAHRFAAGGRYSMADAFVTALLVQLDGLNLSHLWEGAHPAIAVYYGEMRARPSFANAISPKSRPRLFSDRVFFRSLMVHLAAPLALIVLAALVLVLT